MPRMASKVAMWEAQGWGLEAAEEIVAARESHYKAGDWVRLYAEADGENGPHWTDLFRESPLAQVVLPMYHPNNPSWCEGYMVRLWGENVMVKPGRIHRLARKR